MVVVNQRYMRVLIIEDNEKLAVSLKRGLEKNGYAADYYRNGEEAAEHFILNHSEYDAVILDLMLPSRSGLDICMAVRNRGIMTPIVVLTAKDEISSKLTLLDYGADDYIVKPFSFDELLARLRAVMRRPSNLLPDELIFDSVRLIASQHRVMVGSDELKLTNKEFAILELFLRNPNMVLEREFILDHAWDFNFNSLSNIVDVHVKNLRKKLSDTPAGDIIETVSGVGYRLKT